MTRSPATEIIEIVGAEVVGDLVTLDQLVEQVFGRGDRSPGWFARKLVREGVDAVLSSVAVPVGSATEYLGFALLGRAASLGPIVRGAGVGVLEAFRGRGIGRRLIDDAAARARAEGFETIEFLAEPARLAWYRELGFEVVEPHLALLAHGLGSPESAGVEPALGLSIQTTSSLWSWIPEFWTRTAEPERTMVECEGARFWLTREGRAWLALRCELDDRASIVAGVVALRQRLGPTTPLLLYPLPAGAEWVDALVRVGFAVAQRSFVVRRPT